MKLECGYITISTQIPRKRSPQQFRGYPKSRQRIGRSPQVTGALNRPERRQSADAAIGSRAERQRRKYQQISPDPRYRSI